MFIEQLEPDARPINEHKIVVSLVYVNPLGVGLPGAPCGLANEPLCLGTVGTCAELNLNRRNHGTRNSFVRMHVTK